MTSFSLATSDRGLQCRPARAVIRGVLISTDTAAAGDASISSWQPRVFPEHCEDEFNYLAEQHPAELMRLMNSELLHRPTLLTFAAEAAGRIWNTGLVLAVLLPLLDHPEPAVREGAVYGLGPHLEKSLQARDALRGRLGSDPSPGVVEAIQDALRLLQ